MKDYCFWSVGDGDYAWMLQALVDSFHRVGMEGDFHVYTDRKINGAETHLVPPFDKRGFLFKFKFLQNEVKKLNYRHFIYLDADNIFVRKPKRSLLELLGNSPLHFFLESPLEGAKKRNDWWNCPLTTYVKLIRDCGVSSKTIYNLNSGMFILRKDVVDLACDLAQDFWRYALGAGYYFPDEPPWAYAMQMLCDDSEKHLLKDHLDLWCSDWSGEWKDRLPNGEPWTFRDYFTYESREVNPAIVHAIKSKKLLTELGKGLKD